MQYRTYRFTALADPYDWVFTTGGTQYTFRNFDTLTYAAGGAVASNTIDNDYLVDNNSTVNIVAPTSAIEDQIIALIDVDGIKDIGVITSVDNKKLQILYKSMLELFNGATLNALRHEGDDDDSVHYLYDAVDQTAIILAKQYASTNTDRYRRLPLRIRTSGGGKNGSTYTVPAIWSYDENTINIREWLQDLFLDHNIVVQCKLVFEVERAFIEIYIAHNTTGGRLIKNNVHGMTITRSDEKGASATVCQVLDKDTKALLATYYLTAHNTVTTNANHSDRLPSYKLVVAELDQDNDDGATAETVAKDNLLYKDYNHYISIEIDRNSAMYPKDLQIGDAVTIVPTTQEMSAADAISGDYSDDTIATIYTGRKESSKNNHVTLIFGKIRVNYTDIIQLRMRGRLRN